MKSVVVIGGGPAGLKAAHTLVRTGLAVTLLEAHSELGGLASSFELGGVRIERYYHFVCRGDNALVETLEEIGLVHMLRWRRSGMAFFFEGTLYPFLTPLDLLRFRPLGLLDRIRAGIALKRARYMKERDLAPLAAHAWLAGLFGERCYRVVWQPLMHFKFARYSPEISAAWIWARMLRLSRSRQSAWHEELGYIEGGSHTLLGGLARAFKAAGGRLRVSTPVERILVEGSRVRGVRIAGETLPADAVISTIAMPRFRELVPELDEAYEQRLRRVPTIGILCLVLRLVRSVTPYFWVNINDPRVPFAGVIEYTNLNPLPELGGDRVLYIPQYMPADDARYHLDDQRTLREYCDALTLLEPAFDRAQVRSFRVFRDRFAQPICRTDYLDATPEMATPVRGLFLTDSCQLHPHDRTISGAFELGMKAAGLTLEQIETGRSHREG